MLKLDYFADTGDDDKTKAEEALLLGWGALDEESGSHCFLNGSRCTLQPFGCEWWKDESPRRASEGILRTFQAQRAALCCELLRIR